MLYSDSVIFVALCSARILKCVRDNFRGSMIEDSGSIPPQPPIVFVFAGGEQHFEASLTMHAVSDDTIIFRSIRL